MQIYKLYKNKLYIIDDVLQYSNLNISFVLYVATRYKITLWFQNTKKIHNVYISSFLTYHITQEQLQILANCVLDLYNNQNITKAIKKLKYIHIYDMYNYIGPYAFEKNIIVCKCLCFYSIIGVDAYCPYSLLNMCLTYQHIYYIGAKFFKEKHNKFNITQLYIRNITEQQLSQIASMLYTKFYVVGNHYQEYEDGLQFMQDTLRIKFYGGK